MSNLTQTIDSYLNLLGLVMRDRVTNITGMVDAISFDAYGCVQASLRPPVKEDGTLTDGRWFDVKRLVVAGDRIMDAPPFATLARGAEAGAADHTYTLGGKRLPSVTTVLSILQDFGGVPPDVLERAREFGVHVHQAVDYLLRGVLDWDTLDPELLPYVHGAQRFVEESGLVVLASELRVHHPAYAFAGTLDLLAQWKGRLSVIDFKTGAVPRTVGAQTSAYALAHDSMESQPVKRRYCVQLLPDDYRVHPLSDPADRSTFLSALNCWRFKNAV